jgi:hypothetical protein
LKVNERVVQSPPIGISPGVAADIFPLPIRYCMISRPIDVLRCCKPTLESEVGAPGGTIRAYMLRGQTVRAPSRGNKAALPIVDTR